jgi:outer membrane scaffolding protein for murein synthesis (MipA/OmpV family)
MKHREYAVLQRKEAEGQERWWHDIKDKLHVLRTACGTRLKSSVNKSPLTRTPVIKRKSTTTIAPGITWTVAGKNPPVEVGARSSNPV